MSCKVSRERDRWGGWAEEAGRRAARARARAVRRGERAGQMATSWTKARAILDITRRHGCHGSAEHARQRGRRDRGVHGQPRTRVDDPDRRTAPQYRISSAPGPAGSAVERVQRQAASAGCKVAPLGPWGRARPKAAALEGVQPSWLHVSVSGAGLQDQGSRPPRSRWMLAGLLDTCTSVVRQRILPWSRYGRRAAGAVQDGAPGGAGGGRAARGMHLDDTRCRQGVQVGLPHSAEAFWPRALPVSMSIARRVRPRQAADGGDGNKLPAIGIMEEQPGTALDASDPTRPGSAAQVWVHDGLWAASWRAQQKSRSEKGSGHGIDVHSWVFG